MDPFQALALLLACGLLVYLMCAVLAPEWFS